MIQGHYDIVPSTGRATYDVLYERRGGWLSSYTDLVREKHLGGIAATNFPDIAELDRLPDDLMGLSVTLSDPPNLRPLERFSNLRDLSLGLSTRRNVPLDFSSFPRIETLSVDWNAGFGSLFAVAPPTLRELRITKQPCPDLTSYRALAGLSVLRLGAGRRLESTRGAPVGLRKLEIYGQANCHDAGFEDGSLLQTLELQACEKLTDLDGLRPLVHLRLLNLEDCGDLPSIEPLGKLRQLTALGLTGSTNVKDGDLSVLLDLPSLRNVGIADRRHYRPSAQQIRKAFPSG